jgi:transposase
MKRFIEGANRAQAAILPECLDDYISDDNPVRAIEAFVEAVDLSNLGFEGVHPEATGRPSYHPATLLKIYIYGYVDVGGSCQLASLLSGRAHAPATCVAGSQSGTSRACR